MGQSHTLTVRSTRNHSGMGWAHRRRRPQEEGPHLRPAAVI